MVRCFEQAVGTFLECDLSIQVLRSLDEILQTEEEDAHLYMMGGLVVVVAARVDQSMTTDYVARLTGG